MSAAEFACGQTMGLIESRKVTFQAENFFHSFLFHALAHLADFKRDSAFSRFGRRK
jgi:hypothetical protein